MKNPEQKYIDRRFLWLFYLLILAFMWLFFRYGLYSKINWPWFILGFICLAAALWLARRRLRCPNCGSLNVLRRLTLMDNGKKIFCPACNQPVRFRNEAAAKSSKKRKG